MTYKKRAKDGWSAGKRYKKDSNKKERLYAKKEIAQIQKEELEGDAFRYKGAKKKKLTIRQKLEKEIALVKFYIERWTRPNMARPLENGWFSGVVSRYKSRLKKLQEKLKGK